MWYEEMRQKTQFYLQKDMALDIGEWWKRPVCPSLSVWDSGLCEVDWVELSDV